MTSFSFDGGIRVLHVVGARPEFIQMTPVYRALRDAGHESVIVHTGQHYDYPMSDLFFKELDLPSPDYHLGVGSVGSGRQIGAMIAGVGEVLERCPVNWVLVYGDTNSTLAGALAATKMRIPVAHTEAGERSYCKAMPEEVNRILVDRIADLHLCISWNAAGQLAKEGIARSVHLTGDVLLDALNQARDWAIAHSCILGTLGLTPKSYLLATIHRAANTDNPVRLKGIVQGLSSIDEVVVLPLHPRTRLALCNYELEFGSNVKVMDPIGYHDMITLEQNARMIFTDSGGVLREAFLFSVPCVTLRDEIELIELVWSGWNRLVGADPRRIHEAWQQFKVPSVRLPLLGDGNAAKRIVRILERTPADYGRGYDIDTAERPAPNEPWLSPWNSDCTRQPK